LVRVFKNLIFLPEPIGDSIFAVASEEFGFIGSVTHYFTFYFLHCVATKLAPEISDSFGMLTGCGIITLIIAQSFINIGSMLGVLPLTGIPLIFVSQGGTAMLFALAEAGIVLNISKHQRSHSRA
jgi:cell division protein FtsW